jgi:23S rRNA pseudouridine2605 synthase
MTVMAGKEKQPTSKSAPEGERIAKVLSRAGISSRREAERLIELGEVKVNGKTITSPALNVLLSDKITVQGQPVAAPEPARLWLYYKPDGLVSTNSDEKGRETVFDHLPADLPRVMTVGRLDLNSEGLLLLTNDGELKRRLELPSTGWLRKYRVRVKGNPTDPELEPLRKGIVLDGERFQPMSIQLDRHQGANAWLTVGLREGKNREIRRAIDSIGLIVNRLIRISYGPFRLGELQPGDVEEVRAKTLREQLGEGNTDDGSEPAPRKTRKAATRVRPGDGIKALAKAWDEATDAPRVIPRRESDENGRSLAPKRAVTTKSVASNRSRTSNEGRPPAKTARAPREEVPFKYPPRHTLNKEEPATAPKKAVRTDGARNAAGPKSAARPRAAVEDRPARSAPKTARPSGKSAAAKPAPRSASDKPANAGPAIAGPRKAPPKSAGRSPSDKPAIAGPRKPPAKPRRG